MKVEIWSDVLCPWCYIGKRRFETALAQFVHRDEVDVIWRSFELDPAAEPRTEARTTEILAQKYGMTSAQIEAMQENITALAAEEGLEYHLDSTQPGNSFDAHRLIHLGAQQGLQGAVKERLMRAYFTDGLPIGDRETLVRLGVEAGLDEEEVTSGSLLHSGGLRKIRAHSNYARANFM